LYITTSISSTTVSIQVPALEYNNSDDKGSGNNKPFTAVQLYTDNKETGCNYVEEVGICW